MYGVPILYSLYERNNRDGIGLSPFPPKLHKDAKMFLFAQTKTQAHRCYLSL
jgi:hypothetical protein